ncbi:MAG: M23 family metallopeptidase [Candidatus Eisenbacteria bacterium]|nr:M23 family metallopeptidase [Candidatus Eisenbacteria bacterium]
MFPVGDPYSMAAQRGVPEYRVMRGVQARDDSAGAHAGADLANGRSGGVVRAAGNGLVVAVAGRGWHHGYGSHVVLAHRLADGALVYSVYAHLAPASVAVHAGQFVAAGARIGRVGMTGRATSPHLHFEVRLAADPAMRWENTPVADPVAFVRERLPECRGDSSSAKPYVEWAACAALVGRDAAPARGVTRAAWWHALAGAARGAFAPRAADAESLRVALVTDRLLPERGDGSATEPLAWSELARDLERARARGLRLPPSPIGRERRRADCRHELGIDSPARDAGPLFRERRGQPSVGAICLALADIAGDPPRPRAPRKPHAPKSPRIAAPKAVPPDSAASRIAPPSS